MQMSPLLTGIELDDSTVAITCMKPFQIPLNSCIGEFLSTIHSVTFGEEQSMDFEGNVVGDSSTSHSQEEIVSILFCCG